MIPGQQLVATVIISWKKIFISPPIVIIAPIWCGDSLDKDTYVKVF